MSTPEQRAKAAQEASEKRAREARAKTGSDRTQQSNQKATPNRPTSVRQFLFGGKGRK
jgi:hypothetical protein